MMQWLQCVEPQELVYVPSLQARQPGVCGMGAYVPGMHMSHCPWSGTVVDHPAGHTVHHGSLAGAIGQPACAMMTQHMPCERPIHSPSLCRR